MQRTKIKKKIKKIKNLILNYVLADLQCTTNPFMKASLQTPGGSLRYYRYSDACGKSWKLSKNKTP